MSTDTVLEQLFEVFSQTRYTTICCFSLSTNKLPSNLTVREHCWKQLRSVLGRVKWIGTFNKFQCLEFFSFKHIILVTCPSKMVVILELHRLEAAEGLSSQLKLVVMIAMLPLFLLQLNFHFHMIQNRMRIASLAVHLQFYCCFCAFHFPCAILTHTLPCLKRWSLNRSNCIRLFSCQL